MMDYLVKPREGYSSTIGELITMLEHTRETTISEIAELRQSELDYLYEEDANSIGALLLHIASIEAVHQVISFEGRDFNEAELSKWKHALELGENARANIKNNSIDYYLAALSTVRERTLNLFKTKSDDWLYEERTWSNGIPHNLYYLWYHVMEDEISHRGQIRMIRRKLSTNQEALKL
ncbi:DinB family protein [Bacillus spongiae]|uniref:DinB family protein n=1 Tax=Bacillus spongiae TaxID=2683610 RepID=A0ABU8HJ92_9BACI